MPPIDTPYTDIPKSEPSTNPLGIPIPSSTLDSARLDPARLGPTPSPPQPRPPSSLTQTPPSADDHKPLHSCRCSLSHGLPSPVNLQARQASKAFTARLDSWLDLTQASEPSQLSSAPNSRTPGLPNSRPPELPNSRTPELFLTMTR